MKRLPFLLSMIVVLSLVIPAIGQEYYLGVTGGMNIANMKITGDGEEQNVDALNNLAIGGIFGAKFKDNMSLQLRPLYLQKGGTLIQDASDPTIDFMMSYLEVDLSLKITTGDQLRPYLIAGPSIGFLLSAEIEFDAEGNKVTGDVMDLMKNTEFSLGIGAGLEYSLGTTFIFLEGRYLFGLNNLNKGGTVEFEYNGMVVGSTDISIEDEFKNRGFQIMAGVVFPLKN